MNLTSVSTAVFSGSTFDISKKDCEDNKLVVSPLSIFARTFESLQTKQDRLGRIAEAFTEYLHQLPRDIRAAFKNRNVRAVKIFLDKLPKAVLQDVRIQKLDQEFLASKLGVTVKDLERTPGFADWCQKNHLYNYLKAYNHILEIDSLGEIQVKVEDGDESKYVSWSQIDDSLKDAPEPGLFKWAWVYGPNGLQKGKSFFGKTLQFYKKSNPEKWGKRNIVQVCTTAARNGKVRTVGDHTYEKYLTAEGYKYSNGYYRQDKKICEDSMWKDPLRVKQMELQSPDVSVFWDDIDWYNNEETEDSASLTLNKLSIAFTEEQLDTLMKFRENEKTCQRKAIQIMPKNCDYLILRGLREIGIKLPTDAYFWSLYVPKPIRKAVQYSYDSLPKTAQKMVYYGLIFFTLPTVFLLNSLSALLIGASKVDKRLHGIPLDEGLEHVQPTIQTFWDLFDHTKLIMYSPVRLLEVIEEVNEWRAKRTYELQENLTKLKFKKADPTAIQDLEKEIEDVRYSLPPGERFHC